ncbi:dTDP-4-dehydrorhamnose reductase [Treponema primitia ZAS-2]|uniref:dTDP-4-dehydrorhamnose reductase n=1 Tax=Treponema primitia (strain ATCC BAA-887 / DSM 12427 / ZAS-2) TaxID=545694 RepID=F5YHJ5_TREPZ|nr:dTDP-4-dehydrorhamnose reductase [Treponema primitia]AEF85820.1 dTDP-4-dehydrorhamnose reductase [Treponema primitia ZAS-2]
MIWLIGNRGMLGKELSLVFEHRGLAYIGTDRDTDITDPASLSSFVVQHADKTPFTWIINCAAYTAVDKAEDDFDLCRRLNTDGPANVAKTAENIGAKLLHISTDYVFNGKGTLPYREDDPTDPIGIYGLTKRDGETKVFENNIASYIIRTAWLYGKYGNNFVHTMLRLMKDRGTVSVVNDQRGSPTWANDLSNTITDLIIAVDSGKTLPFGVYHFTNEGDITWFEFAREIYVQGRKLGILTKDCEIKPCTSADFPAKVTRPSYSVLDKGKIKSALGITIPEWNTSLGKFLTICEN